MLEHNFLLYGFYTISLVYILYILVHIIEIYRNSQLAKIWLKLPLITAFSALITLSLVSLEPYQKTYDDFKSRNDLRTDEDKNIKLEQNENAGTLLDDGKRHDIVEKASDILKRAGGKEKVDPSENNATDKNPSPVKRKSVKRSTLITNTFDTIINLYEYRIILENDVVLSIKINGNDYIGEIDYLPLNQIKLTLTGNIKQPVEIDITSVK